MIDNYKKLNVKKYLELQSIDIEGKEEIDVQVSILSILYDMTEDDVLNLPIPEYKKLVQSSSFLINPPIPYNNIPDTISINNKKYKVIKDIKKMTAGQYIDYQNYITDKTPKILPYLLSCFLIPQNKKYGEDLEEVINDIGYLSILDAISLSAFFLKKWESSTRATLIYLIWKMKRMMKKEKNEIVKEQMKMAIQKMTMLKNTIKGGDGFLGVFK